MSICLLAHPVIRPLATSLSLALLATLAQAQPAPHAAVHALAQQEQQPLLDTLRDLVHIESGSKDLEGLDKIAALIKCIEEEKSGKLEFRRAGQEHLDNLRKSPLPEVIYFLDHFLPGYRLSLDELRLG